MADEQTSVLITGAAGFLGRHFVEHHLKAGDIITVVDDLSGTGSHWPAGPHNRIEDDAGLYFKFASTHHHRFDLAYHFAAPVGGRVKIEHDPLFNADSLRLDSLFFRWAIGNVGIAIYPSSSAVYGWKLQEGRGAILKEADFRPAESMWYAPDEMYGFTKMAGEILAYKAEAYGLNTLCIRPFSGYGEGQSTDYPIPSILSRAKRQEDPLRVWGTGMQRRDFVHVDDVVGATIARTNAGVLGYQAMNISSGFALSFIDIARTASEIVGYAPKIEGVPDKPVGVSTRYGDNHEMSKYYNPVVSVRDGLRRVLESLDA